MNKSHSPWWKRLLRGAFFAFVALLTLVALAAAGISFQGRREWARTKADLLARGERLSLIELAPPPIPDEQNFFGDPLWSEVFELETSTDKDGQLLTHPKVPYREQKLDRTLHQPLSKALRERGNTLPGIGITEHPGTLPVTAVTLAMRRANSETDRQFLAQFSIDALRPLSPMLARITALLQRPGARAQVDYSLGLTTPMPHLSSILYIGQVLTARAMAELYLGDSESSKADVLSILRLSNTLKTEPLLISLLIRTSIIGMANTVISAGIYGHLWTEPQLVEFTPALGGIDLLPQFAQVLRGERGIVNQFVELARRSPARAYEIVRPGNHVTWKSGRFDRASYEIGSRLFNSSDQSQFNLAMQSQADAIERASGRGLSPVDFTSPKTDDTWRKLFHPLWALYSSTTRDSPPACIVSYVMDQTSLTRIACALERYRMRHRSYPANLHALAPDLLPELPSAAIAGQKIQYRLEGNGRFQLWTAGWNQIDEGGTLPSIKEGSKYRWRGDWAWWVPLPPLPPKSTTLAL